MANKAYHSASYNTRINHLIKLILRVKLYSSKVLLYTKNLMEQKENSELLRKNIFDLAKKTKRSVFELEDLVTKIIALSQPLGFDLRFVISSMKVVSELEHIADWVKKTVKAIERIDDNIPADARKAMLEMIEISFETLRDAISVLLQYDNKKERLGEALTHMNEMMERDNLVDDLYNSVLKRSLEKMKKGESDAVLLLEIIGISKNLEKVSDCINNIIVTTKYVLTGERAG